MCVSYDNGHSLFVSETLSIQGVCDHVCVCECVCVSVCVCICVCVCVCVGERSDVNMVSCGADKSIYFRTAEQVGLCVCVTSTSCLHTRSRMKKVPAVGQVNVKG